MTSLDKSHHYLHTRLRYVQAVEFSGLEMLQTQAQTLRDCRDLARKLWTHHEESCTHLNKIAECLKILGEEKPSIILNSGAGLAGFPCALRDENTVENAARLYMFEHHEISQYKILIEAARHAGQESIMRLCEESLCQEEEMAYWLEYHFADIAEKFFHVYASPASPGAPQARQFA